MGSASAPTALVCSFSTPVFFSTLCKLFLVLVLLQLDRPHTISPLHLVSTQPKHVRTMHNAQRLTHNNRCRGWAADVLASGGKARLQPDGRGGIDADLRRVCGRASGRSLLGTVCRQMRPTPWLLLPGAHGHCCGTGKVNRCVPLPLPFCPPPPTSPIQPCPLSTSPQQPPRASSPKSARARRSLRASTWMYAHIFASHPAALLRHRFLPPSHVPSLSSFSTLTQPFPFPSSLSLFPLPSFPFFPSFSPSFSSLPFLSPIFLSIDANVASTLFFFFFFFLSFFFFFSPRASAFSPDFYALTVLRFVVGIGIGGMGVPFDLLAEFMPPKLRGKALISIEFFWYARTCSLPPLSPSLCVCSLSVICHKAHSPTP